MKKLALFTFLSVLVLGLSGCYCNRNMSSPGPVIKSADTGAKNKVIMFQVIGKGVEPESALTKGQAMLMAERAAIADGYRQLVEKIKGVYVDAYTKAGFGAIDQDVIRTQTHALLRGVNIRNISHGEYGIAKADMALQVYFSRHKMIWWPQGLGTPPLYNSYASNKGMNRHGGGRK